MAAGKAPTHGVGDETVDHSTVSYGFRRALAATLVVPAPAMREFEKSAARLLLRLLHPRRKVAGVAITRYKPTLYPPTPGPIEPQNRLPLIPKLPFTLLSP